MVAEIPLTRGYVALVDDSDLAAVLAVGRWQLNVCAGKHYAGHATNAFTVRMHTFLTGWTRVDHHNGDGLDNRRANLRPATASQNGANISAPTHNTSGYKGVHYYARTGRWRAYITVDQAQRHLGYYSTAIEAAAAYDDAAVAAWGEFARLNITTRTSPTQEENE